jgi:hypothetical protein
MFANAEINKGMTVNKMIKNVTNNDLYKYLNKEFYS